MSPKSLAYNNRLHIKLEYTLGLNCQYVIRILFVLTISIINQSY